MFFNSCLILMSAVRYGLLGGRCGFRMPERNSGGTLPMTPLDFADEYRTLQTFMYPPEAGVTPKSGNPTRPGLKVLRVALYRLGHSPWAGSLWQDVSSNFKKPVTLKINTVDGGAEEVTMGPQQAHRHFVQPFAGKGSPEQVQIAIQLVYRFHGATFTPEQFVQKFVGLDCNGFVGNYIQRVVQGVDWNKQDNDKDPGPTTYISGLLEAQGKDNQITDLKDMCADDIYILGMCEPNGKVIDPQKGVPNSYGHVMITNPGAPFKLLSNGAEFKVVESCGGKGLVDRLYTIDQVTKINEKVTVFHVLRGSPSDKMNVRIARLAT
jgi:hypothetical protein